MSLVERIKRKLNAPDLDEYLKRKGKNMTEPGIISKAFRIAREFAKWTKAGNPVRTPKEIIRIFNNFCKPCEHFSVDHCKICGCKLNDGTGLNKILWATSSCPLEDNPKWVSDINVEMLDENVDESVTESGLLVEEAPPEPAPAPPVAPKRSGCGCS
jgi:hypothetical protein